MTSISVLGLHDGHNASAALVVDGGLKAAVQEERFTRRKNQGDAPHQSIDHLVGVYRSAPSVVAVSSNYMRYGEWTREAVLASYASSSGIVKRATQPLKGTWIDRAYQRRLNGMRQSALDLNRLGSEVVTVEHHLCHASAAYYGSGWTDGECLVLTCDGSGDRISATVSIGRNGTLERIASVDENDSLGRLYAVVTFHLGMVPLEHEYKVMGLAPYVDARTASQGAELFADLFEWPADHPLTWRRRRGVPPLYAAYDFLRQRLERTRFDIVAAGLQRFTEEFLCRWVATCVRETGVTRVACGGGVFMNVKANGAILSLPEVDQLFVYPSCGDETNAMGAAYWVTAQRQSAAGVPVDVEPIGSLCLGPTIDDDEVVHLLSTEAPPGVRWRAVDDIERLVVDQLVAGEIVARAKGPVEFGARALGNRSILAAAHDTRIVREINEMIKGRDFWMPFAPSVLGDRASDYYVKPKDMPAPHMIVTFDSRPDRRDRFPAALHPYDHTTRPQEVYEDSNAEYWRLLKEYEARTGEAIILNTSFNLHGEPIVMSPADALSVFTRSGLRYLALGNVWVWKDDV